MDARETFAMETTLSGRAHLALLARASERGLATAMLYFAPRDPAICLERIARRVAEGGHDVTEPVVRRRFARSLSNLPAYTAACDLWRVYEASGGRPVLAMEGAGQRLTLTDEAVTAAAHPTYARLASSLSDGR